MHYRGMVHTVTLLTREGCGSCVRVHGQLLPLCEGAGARLEVTDVDRAADPDLAAEYGVSVPLLSNLLHGHTYQLPGGGPRKDTSIVLPGTTLRVEFDADNPGRWLTHCHNVYHGEAGMMTTIAYQEN